MADPAPVEPDQPSPPARPAAPGGRLPALRTEPLWVRVDRNRIKLAVFIALFVAGSAVLLSAALVGVPGALIGLAFHLTPFGLPTLAGVAVAVLAGFGVLLVAGGLASAVQLANADDWVRGRLCGREPAAGEAAAMRDALREMALAAGMALPPALVIVPGAAVNAFAVGATRRRPLLGVTEGLLGEMTAEEQRAVAAALVARIVAGDILFGTALAALMGPLKAFREWRPAAGGDGEAATGSAGCSGRGCLDAGDGCGCLFDALDSDDSHGCAGFLAMIVFLAVVAALTYVAVRVAAWIVTLWGRLLHRTGHEKADAEGMLLLKDPEPMIAALRKALLADNAVIAGDPSYDGVFYTSTSGRPGLERAERRRLERLCQILGVEGARAWDSIEPAETAGEPGTPRG